MIKPGDGGGKHPLSSTPFNMFTLFCFCVEKVFLGKAHRRRLKAGSVRATSDGLSLVSPPETVCLSPPTLCCLQLLPLPLLSTTQPITFRVQGLISWSDLWSLPWVKPAKKKKPKQKRKIKKNVQTFASWVSIGILIDRPFHFFAF